MLTPRRVPEDGGFTLIEVMLACTVLMVLAGAVGLTLTDSLRVSKSARQRVAASNLAAREVEITRNQFFSSDADVALIANSGTVTDPHPLTGTGPSVVDGTSFSVRRQVEWLPTGNGTSACDGGSLVNHPSLRVNVQVTWPRMATVKPVRATSLLTPPKGTLDNLSTAFLAMKVQNAAGLPTVGVPMSASGPGGSFSGVTDSSGCAVFQVGTAGSYNVVLNQPGWVDQTGVQNSAKPVVVSAGSLARSSMTYDQAASMDITLTAQAGYPIAGPLPAVNYTKPNVPVASSRQTFASSSTTTRVTGLWPTTNGYAAWAGGCPDSDPAGPPTGGNRGAPVVMAPGALGSVTASLAPVSLTVATSTGTPVAGVVVTATSTSCTTYDKTLVLGTSNASGKVLVSIPYGQWQLSGTYLSKTFTEPITPTFAGVTTQTFEVT